MSFSFYFFDSSAITKLYAPEIASHIVQEIYNNPSNMILYSDLAYTETVSALSKKRNKKFLTDDELNRAINSFKHDFMINPSHRHMPISMSDIMVQTQDVLLEAHQIKNNGRPDIQYLQSLDSIQVASWLDYAEQLNCKFVTGDAKLARVVEAIIAHRNLDLEVINVSTCECSSCLKIAAIENVR